MTDAPRFKAALTAGLFAWRSVSASCRCQSRPPLRVMAMVIPAVRRIHGRHGGPAGTAILVAMDGLTAATEGLAAALAMGGVTDAPSAAMAVMEDRATDPAPPQRTISPAVDATEVAVMSVPRNKAGRGARR